MNSTNIIGSVNKDKLVEIAGEIVKVFGVDANSIYQSKAKNKNGAVEILFFNSNFGNTPGKLQFFDSQVILSVPGYSNMIVSGDEYYDAMIKHLGEDSVYAKYIASYEAEQKRLQSLING